jgi:hypothetical protein
MSSNEKQAYKWVFTYNTSDEGITTQEAYDLFVASFRLNENVKDATFQQEIGDETGRPHIQGRLHFVNKRTKNGVLNLFKTIYSNSFTSEPKCAILYNNTTVSIELDASASIAYCSKDDTRILGTESWSKLPKSLRYTGADVLCLDREMRPWQKQLMTIINDRPYNSRHVYWLACNEGGSGKSIFLKYLQFKSEYSIGEISDAGSATQLKATSYNIGPKEIYFVDLPRVRSDSLEDIMRTVETIKNGKLSSVLYGGSEVILFNPPLMIIFANYYPNVGWMSKDRWQIYQITPEFEMIKQSVDKVRNLTEAKKAKKI